MGKEDISWHRIDERLQLDGTLPHGLLHVQQPRLRLFVLGDIEGIMHIEVWSYRYPIGLPDNARDLHFQVLRLPGFP